MDDLEIEAILASPPERDELVVQLFVKNGGQFAEIYREETDYWIELYLTETRILKFRVDVITSAITRSKQALIQRLEGE